MHYSYIYITLDKDQIVEHLKNLPNKMLKERNFFFKGITMPSSGSNYYIIEPQKHRRPGKTKDKFGDAYNLLINNLQNWNNYPKRCKSIILTTSEKTSKQFGESYAVFPLYNASIVISPESDIWYSFRQTLMKAGLAGKDLSHFNNVITEIVSLVNGGRTTDYDWNLMLQSFIKFDNLDFAGKISSQESISFIKKYTESGMKLLEFLGTIIDPGRNDFKLIKYNEEFRIKEHFDKEVWTDSICVLVKNELVGELMGNI
jgi:hypothetical protein